MIQSWITHCPLSVCETRSDHRVFPTPSIIPYGGFSPVRLQTRSRSRPSPVPPAYTASQSWGEPLWRRSARLSRSTYRRSRPEALGSPGGYVVRPGQCLLWPHPSHSRPSRGLLFSSTGDDGGEWVPNLSCVSVRTCRLQYPGGPRAGVRLLLAHAPWPSPNPQGLGVHIPRKLVHAWPCNEAGSSSLALRPARWLALHQQGHLLPSFRRTGRPARRRLSLHRYTVNSYGRTCTGKTHSRMGCERMARIGING
jgi:hypothetical protein